jgi:hypothetical protein
MSSDYKLTPQRVRDVVPTGATGFYRVGSYRDGRFWPHYVGRSDTRLQSRLLDHARSQRGTHFEAVVTDTIRRAFELECRGWHLWGDRLENKVHPARPKFLGYACPYCALEEQLQIPHTH